MILIMRISEYIWKRLWWLFNTWRFKKLEISSYIDRPLRINGSKNIEIEKNVLINYKTWLAASPLTDNNKPILKIKEGAVIGSFNHIYATNKIIIEENVLIADKVYITDNLHCYEDIKVPIKNQKIIQLNQVTIGAGSWLGEHVCVIGANIGKNCVIGANSVVTKNIPDYCVAVGSPAKIIKKYDIDQKKWIVV